MINVYSPFNGVPSGNFFLKQITEFGDYECPERYQILCYSKDRQSLLDYCKKKEYDLGGIWPTYEIAFYENHVKGNMHV